MPGRGLLLPVVAALVFAVPTAAAAAPAPVDPRGDIRPKPRPLDWQPLGPQPIAGMQRTDPPSISSDFYNGRAPYSGRVTAIAPDPATRPPRIWDPPTAACGRRLTPGLRGGP